MATKFYDRVKSAVSGTPGTGTITLGGAPAGYRSFSGAGVTNGAVVSYVIEDGSNYEFGHGTYATSPNTLTRTTVLGSSAGGAAITASSSATVYLTLLAEDLTSFGGSGGVPNLSFHGPVPADFTPRALFGGTTALTMTAGPGGTMLQTPGATGDSVTSRALATAGEAFTMTARVRFNTIDTTSNGLAIFLGDGTNIVGNGIYFSNASGVPFNTHNYGFGINSSGYQGNYDHQLISTGGAVWLQLVANTAGDTQCKISIDGTNWLTQSTISRGAVGCGTYTEYGFYYHTDGSAAWYNTFATVEFYTSTDQPNAFV